MISLTVSKLLSSHGSSMQLTAALDIAGGELIALYGKSGAGKTTLLRMLAGLADPDDGTITVGDKPWFDSKRRINLPPQRRKVGFVFQDYALFQNLNVKENIAFALKNKNDHSYLDSLIEMMELTEIRYRKPVTLSGGEAQRTALARALAMNPDILLLDEPLSALDRETRMKLQDEILKIHRELKITTVLVSHDLGEIFKLADRVYKIDAGKITASGKPSEVFLDQTMSSKFKFMGEVLEILRNDVVYVVTVLIGNDVVKVIATEEEVESLHTGDRVMVASKAFNPIIMKI